MLTVCTGAQREYRGKGVWLRVWGRGLRGVSTDTEMSQKEIHKNKW